jgi:hypothetical protein
MKAPLWGFEANPFFLFPGVNVWATQKVIQIGTWLLGIALRGYDLTVPTSTCFVGRYPISPRAHDMRFAGFHNQLSMDIECFRRVGRAGK